MPQNEEQIRTLIDDLADERGQSSEAMMELLRNNSSEFERFCLRNDVSHKHLQMFLDKG